MKEFKYLGTTLSNLNSIQEEIKSRLKSENACCYSVQNLRLGVFENRVLRRIFGLMRDEVRKEWRKLHNEELNDQCSSPNIIRVIKSRRKRWAEHVELMGERRLYRFLFDNMRVRGAGCRTDRNWPKYRSDKLSLNLYVWPFPLICVVF
jgi:hypothetical protein